MITYQDLQALGTDEQVRMDFVKSTINKHISSPAYKEAVTAYEYFKKKNTTIVQYQKLLYTVRGEAVPDNFSANYKLCSGFFKRFVTQENQYLLGNGVNWENKKTVDKLGTKTVKFDTQLQKAGKEALICGVSFGFWNMDHLDVFTLREFFPLYDEEDGGLKAGIRFWQIDSNKPLRATLYELDGYTQYIWRTGDSSGEILKPKRAYKQTVAESPADGAEIIDGENYPSFPIVPLYGNPEKQSELVGLRENIDCYDLIKSGFANTVDEASMVYWTIQNAGGMDDVDLAKFMEHMKTVRAAVVEDDGARAESHMVEAPYQSRETLLQHLSNDLYRDFMGLDTNQIAGGAVTATQIKASYEPLDEKTNEYEYCVLDFLYRILALANIPDENPSFTRSRIVNVEEEVNMILAAANYLPQEYITKKLLMLFGDVDKTDEVLKMIQEEQMQRLAMEAVANGETNEENA